MNLFQKARSFLPAQEQRAAGETVTYARGAESLTLTAVVGNTVFATNVEGAARISFGDRDYLIGVADLTLGAPRIGDRVHHVVGGAALVFEVQDLDGGEPAWRHSDPDRTTWRVHVKRVL